MNQQKARKTIDVFQKIAAITGGISAVAVAIVHILQVLYPLPPQQTQVPTLPPSPKPDEKV